MRLLEHGTVSDDGNVETAREEIGMAMRRLNAVVIAFFLALGLVVQGALPARACSCMMPDPYRGLAEADGGFVGTLVEVDRPSEITNSGQLVDFHFQVETVVKGDIGDEVVVKSAASGASCGFELPVGERAGFLLTLENGEWLGNLCWTMDPDLLLSAAEGPPHPVQGSPPHLVLITQMGDAGLVAIDRDGNVVGYGAGPSPLMVSACPDDETFIGLTQESTIEVWAYRDLGVIEEHPLDPEIAPWFTHLVCTEAGGSGYLALTTLSGVDRTSLVRHADGETEVILDSVDWLVDTAAGPVAVTSDGSILAVDPGTGATTDLAGPIGEIHGQLASVAPSPDGTHLAFGLVDWNVSPVAGRAVVVDLINGTTVETQIACDVYPVWLDDETISIWDSCNSDVPTIYDAQLNVIGEGDLPDRGYWSWSITDEEGAVFQPGNLGVTVLEPGADATVPFGPEMGYVAAAVLVPETARADWVGSGFVPAPVPDVVEPVPEPLPTPEPIPVPVEDTPSSYDAPMWLIVVGVVVVGGAIWLLVSEPSQDDLIGSERPA
jgi:hypothetical protein